MVQHWAIFFLVWLSVGRLRAQDERYFRQIFTGELPKVNDEVTVARGPQFTVSGAHYRVDLDGDRIEEVVIPQKRDGVDWLEIRNSSQRTLFEARLLPMGAFSALYKVKLVHLSTTTKALLLFLDEGHTVGRRFESTARLFVLSYEDNDLSRATLVMGPHFFHETEKQRDQYLRRDFTVNVVDVDGDGTREILVHYNHIQRLLRYLGKGDWERR
jgi:hypothetical protein